MCVCVCMLSAKALQSCPALCNPMDYSPPGFAVHSILQARILEWVSMPSSKGSSPPRDRTHISYISCIGSGVIYHWATWKIFKSKFLPQLPAALQNHPSTRAGWGVRYQVLTVLLPGSSWLQLPSSLSEFPACLPTSESTSRNAAKKEKQ